MIACGVSGPVGNMAKCTSHVSHKRHGMEGAALGDVLAFEVRTDQFMFFAGHLGHGYSGKAGGVAENAADVLEIPRVVGHDEQLSAWLEDSPGLVEEGWLNQSAAVVPAFGPRVREVHVNPPQALVWQRIFHERPGIGAEHSHVIQPGPAESVRRVDAISPRPFDAEEVQVGPPMGSFQQECALARADFQLDRPLVAEQFPQVHRAQRG